MVKVQVTCSIEGCEKPAKKRGWCPMHYRRWHRYGDPLHVERIHGDLRARIESYTDRRPNGCWLWTGGHFPKGYGVIQVDGKARSVHRVVWELDHGPIPDGLVIDHLCHNSDPDCLGGDTCLHRGRINPDHLGLCTPGDNTLRSRHTIPSQHAARTACKNGHEFTPENTYIRPNGARGCVTCRREAWHRWKSRQ